MKLRKIVLLPLLLVALASCGNRNSSSQDSANSTPPSQDGSASNSTSQGGSGTSTVTETPVTAEAANTRVAAAFEKIATETLTSVDLSVAVDAFAQRKLALLDSGEVTENDSIEVAARAAVKAKDLDKEDAQFAISGSAEATLSMQEEAFAAIDVEGGIYYVDNFVYLDLTLGEHDLESGDRNVNSQKRKMEIGPFPGLESLLGELLGETPLPEDLPEDLPEIELNIVDLLAKIGAIEATESNDVLTVKYEITTADIYKIILAMNQEVFGSLTPEEFAGVVASLQAMIDDVLVIREAVITIKIDKNALLTGLAIELDLDVMNQAFAWDETGEDTIEAIETITIRGSLDISLKINEEVAISFPNFADYELIDEEN